MLGLAMQPSEELWFHDQDGRQGHTAILQIELLQAFELMPHRDVQSNEAAAGGMMLSH